MKRFLGWERILDEHLQDDEGLPFAWGERDCCIWPCNIVLAFTGVDLAADLRGKYSSAVEAAALMAGYAHGGAEALADTVAKKFDVEEIPPLYASRGDIVLVKFLGVNSGRAHMAEWIDDESTVALAIVELDGRFAATFCPDGLVHIPQQYWKRGWRI